MLHATETRISSGRVGLWFVCAFTFKEKPARRQCSSDEINFLVFGLPSGNSSIMSGSQKLAISQKISLKRTEPRQTFAFRGRRGVITGCIVLGFQVDGALNGWGEGGGAYNRNRGVYGTESINPPQPEAANLIVRPNQKQTTSRAQNSATGSLS